MGAKCNSLKRDYGMIIVFRLTLFLSLSFVDNFFLFPSFVYIFHLSMFYVCLHFSFVDLSRVYAPLFCWTLLFVLSLHLINLLFVFAFHLSTFLLVLSLLSNLFVCCVSPLTFVYSLLVVRPCAWARALYNKSCFLFEFLFFYFFVFCLNFYFLLLLNEKRSYFESAVIIQYANTHTSNTYSLAHAHTHMSTLTHSRTSNKVKLTSQ